MCLCAATVAGFFYATPWLSHRHAPPETPYPPGTAARNLHADGQTRRRETATYAYGREPGDIERYRVAGQKISSSIREVDSFAVGFDIAAVTILDGRRGREQRRRNDHLHALEGTVELLAEEPPDPLSGYVYGSGNQKAGNETVKQSWTVVPRPCSQIVIMIGVRFRPGAGGLQCRNQIHMRDRDFLSFHAERF